jgi:hypothetical protein
MKQISIEVVSRVLTTYGHCIRCEPIFLESGVGKKIKLEDMDDYPDELKEDSLKLSELICELYRIYRHKIRIRLIDALSPTGIYKSFVYRFREYPTFIIANKDVCRGMDRKKIEDLIDKYIKASYP